MDLPILALVFHFILGNISENRSAATKCEIDFL